MRCGTLRFGSVAVRLRCGAVIYVTVYVQRDRTASRLIFEIRAQTENSANFGKIQVFSLNCAEGILQCRRPLLNSNKTSL